MTAEYNPPILRTAARRCLASILLAVAMAPFRMEPLQAQEPQRSVLFLVALRRENPGGIILGPLMEQRLAEALGGDVDIYSEYLDPGRFSEGGIDDALRQFFNAKYQHRRFDLIVAADSKAHEFLERHRDEVFPGSPVVYFSANPADKPFPHATGITVLIDFRATLESALQLQPETEHVVVVTGAAAWDRRWESIARAQFAPLEGTRRFTYLSGLPLPALLERVATLEPRSIVFMVIVTEDGSGRRYPTLYSTEQISAAANRPMYSWADPVLGHGIVGGRLFSPATLSAEVVRLSLRVLAGEDPDQIPATAGHSDVLQVDWRQMRRWQLPESRLPAGTAVLYREPGTWEQYKLYILGGAALLTIQAGLIAALLVQRTRRRHAEQTSQRTSERHALATAAGSVGIWEWDSRTQDLYVDPGFKHLLGFDDAALPSKVGALMSRVHPDDRGEVQAKIQACVQGSEQGFVVDHRILRADGSVRWVTAKGSVMMDPVGGGRRLLGTAIDITERKRAEDAIRARDTILMASHREIQTLAGRLIAAQEAERTRIARDLHDDIGQDLAALSIGLSSLRRRIAPLTGSEDMQAEVASLQEQTVSLARNVRHVSHDLHPAILQHAGIAAAVTAYCDELRRLHHPLTITVQADGDLSALESGVSLCLYRVTQEALRNVVTHARATHVGVRLAAFPDRVEVSITDDGLGFDSHGPREAGLGLISMSERVRVAGGVLEVTSERGSGTRLHATLPRQAPALTDTAAVETV